MPVQSPGCYLCLWLASMIPSSPEAREALSLGFYGGFIMSARLIKSLAIGDWTESLAPLPSLKIGGGRTERSQLLVTYWFPWQPAPILRTFQKYLINIFRCDWQGLVMSSKQYSELLPWSRRYPIIWAFLPHLLDEAWNSKWHWPLRRFPGL